MARCPSCSQNAHDKHVLAWDKSASRRARGWAGENIARSEGQSGDSLSRSDVRVKALAGYWHVSACQLVGRVRKSRAVGD